MRIFATTFFAVALTLPLAAQSDSAPVWAGELELNSSGGYYSLNWAAAPGSDVTSFYLEEAASPDFAGADRDERRQVYDGEDSGTTISGKADGTYYYRVHGRKDDGSRTPWSKTLGVTVRHHSLPRAFAFLITGALVFLATAVMILGGYRRERSKS